MDQCSLLPLFADICSLNENEYYNSSLGYYDSDALLSPTSDHVSPQDSPRSRTYNIFRKASVPHGFGSEYQSELRKLVGEKWTDSWVIWTLAMPGTFVLGVLAQLMLKKIFGRLRMPERQHTRERLWNYAFYKFIFIFGVVNVESMEEMIIWIAWFVLLGYVHFFIVLSRDRCEYMTFSPVPARKAHSRIVVLLASIIGFAVAVLAFSLYIFCAEFFHTGLFTAAEGALILLPSWHILLRYGYHHLRQGKCTAKWEKRTTLYYYLNLFFEVGTLLVDLSHHVHMMCEVCNVSASSLVIVAQIRFLCVELINKYRRHRNYAAIRRRLQETYPSASDDEIEQQGKTCSICWDEMECARKLHCGHVFHDTCLLSWLEQDVSCPICRVGLNDTFNVARTGRNALNGRAVDEGGRFFHFQGSRILRWLPNVSVTVSHPLYELSESGSVEVMADQVRQVFPLIPHHAVIQDLLETGSAELTIENILSGSFTYTQPVLQTRPTSEAFSRPLTTVTIGGAMREIPDTPEACRALQIQRKETLVYEARKKFLERLAKEKSSGKESQAVDILPQLDPPADVAIRHPLDVQL